MLNKFFAALQVVTLAITAALLCLIGIGLWASVKHREAAACYRAGGGEECASSNSRATRIADWIMQKAT